MKRDYNAFNALIMRHAQQHLPTAGADFAEDDEDEDLPSDERPGETRHGSEKSTQRRNVSKGDVLIRAQNDDMRSSDIGIEIERGISCPFKERRCHCFIAFRRMRGIPHLVVIAHDTGK